MRHKIFLFLSVLLLHAHSSFASEPVLASVPDASVVGTGTLSYVFWDIYKATLYAPDGRWNPAEPFALTIEYRRALEGKDIADRTVQEIRKQGYKDEVRLAAWNSQMKSIIPDVKEGSVLSAVYLPGKETIFYNDDEKIGIIKGDEFSKQFFGIWLNNKTSEPELRRALLGL